MKKFKIIFMISLLFIFSVNHSLAQRIPQDISTYLQNAAANVDGAITFDSGFEMDRGRAGGHPYVVRAKPRRIDFKVNESSAEISSNGGLEISVRGIRFKVKKITYNNRTGRFTTDVEETGGLINSTIGAMFDDDVEGALNGAIEGMFKSKMRTAFRRIRALRGSRTLQGGSSEINQILDILKPSGNSSASMPAFNVTTRLNTRAPRDQRVTLGTGTYAHINRGQRFSTFIRQRYTPASSGRRSSIRITSLAFEADGNTGLEINTSQDDSTFLTAYVKRVSLSEDNGFQMDATNSADATLAVLAQVFQMANDQSAGRAPRLRGCNCEIAQGQIESYVTRELKDYVRENRQTLLRAGFSTRFLTAVLRDRVGGAVAMTEFMVY